MEQRRFALPILGICLTMALEERSIQMNVTRLKSELKKLSEEYEALSELPTHGRADRMGFGD